MITSDIEDAVLHRLQRFCDPGDGAAIAFDEIDRVTGFGGAPLDLGHEKVRYISNIDCRTVRMTRPDPKCEILCECRGGTQCGHG